MSLVVVIVAALCVCAKAIGSCGGFSLPSGSNFPYMIKIVMIDSASASGYTFDDNYFHGGLCSFSHPDATPFVIRDKSAYNWSVDALSLNNRVQGAIGLRQTSKVLEPDGNWFWYDQVALYGDSLHPRYVGWKLGDPSNSLGDEDCGEMRPDGMNDISCNITLEAMFCEVHSKFFGRRTSLTI
jgi:hypothetical protein